MAHIIIQTSHIEKELLSNLDGIKTVFDGGAGCGRFSILLAKHLQRLDEFRQIATLKTSGSSTLG